MLSISFPLRPSLSNTIPRPKEKTNPHLENLNKPKLTKNLCLLNLFSSETQNKPI